MAGSGGAGERICCASAGSFGSSSIGHPLFPFNPAAIGQLVERHCKVKEQGLVFIPRNILHEILREPLKKYRQNYLDGQFPPSQFAEIVCNPALQQRVRLEGLSQPERINSLLAVWGGNSTNLAGLTPAICKEFGLPDAAVLWGAVERHRNQHRNQYRNLHQYRNQYRHHHHHLMNGNSCWINGTRARRSSKPEPATFVSGSWKR